MLVFKLEEYLPFLKPFLLYLSFWPKTININKVTTKNQQNNDKTSKYFFIRDENLSTAKYEKGDAILK